MKYVRNLLPIWLAMFGAWPLVPWHIHDQHGMSLALLFDLIVHIAGVIWIWMDIVRFLRENRIAINIKITRSTKSHNPE